MINDTHHSVRIQELRDLIDESGFTLTELFEDWNGDEGEDPLEALSEAELEALFDRLEDLDEQRTR